MQDKDLLKYGLEITCADAYELALTNKEAFITLRRDGLGASDSSIYLGVNKFTTVDDLIAQKLSKTVTQEEIEVGEKEAVRKGADLEPLILNKFEHWSGFDVYKPDAMYRIKEYPQLTINFDGIIELEGSHIPVEAKYVSPYANKYWDRSKCIKAPFEGQRKVCAGTGVIEHINLISELYGIPPYYYTQVQQQLMALNAPFGYLAALFDKGWELGVYKIHSDNFVQSALITASKELWTTIETKKKGSN